MCNRCHTCGALLENAQDGQWCPACQQVRRYRSHGYDSADGDHCPSLIEIVANLIFIAATTDDPQKAKWVADRLISLPGIGAGKQKQYMEFAGWHLGWVKKHEKTQHKTT